MRLYYKGNTILGSLRTVDLFPDSINFSGMNYYVVDELNPTNNGICKAIIALQWRTDVNGNPRFYIDNDGDLYDRSTDPGGWEPHYTPMPEYGV